MTYLVFIALALLQAGVALAAKVTAVRHANEIEFTLSDSEGWAPGDHFCVFRGGNRMICGDVDSISLRSAVGHVATPAKSNILQMGGFRLSYDDLGPLTPRVGDRVVKMQPNAPVDDDKPAEIWSERPGSPGESTALDSWGRSQSYDGISVKWGAVKKKRHKRTPRTTTSGPASTPPATGPSAVPSPTPAEVVQATVPPPPPPPPTAAAAARATEAAVATPRAPATESPVATATEIVAATPSAPATQAPAVAATEVAAATPGAPAARTPAATVTEAAATPSTPATPTPSTTAAEGAAVTPSAPATPTPAATVTASAAVMPSAPATQTPAAIAASEGSAPAPSPSPTATAAAPASPAASDEHAPETAATPTPPPEAHWDITAGANYTFPMVHLQRRLSPSLAFGFMPTYLFYPTDQGTIVGTGGLFTLSFTPTGPFKDLWLTFGIGAYQFKAELNGNSESFSSPAGMINFGWRWREPTGLNFGFGVGVNSLFDARKAAAGIPFSHLLPSMILDIGFTL